MSINAYLKTRAVSGPWRIEGCTEGGYAGAVVIPALAESPHLFATLSSLAANPPEYCRNLLVLVVVNQREDATPADRDDNQVTLEQLRSGKGSASHLKLAWVDASSPGLELPAKGGGVGLARKIGLDLALTRLDHGDSHAFLTCLDADTLVQPDYLAALRAHFATNSCGGAVIPFVHQRSDSPAIARAIVRYELFLRSYVLGLSLAGSPYAFHTVGSAMACRADAYLRMGGMNSRSAGEDFYFLQQLARTSGIAQVRGTTVFPSPRASHRVPFGTGRSIARQMGGDSDTVLFYRSDCFRILSGWLKLVKENGETAGEQLLMGAGKISADLADYLESIRCAETWDKLRRNHPRPAALQKAFDDWFDGLRTMKLIHHLSAGPLPRCQPEETVPDLLAWGGLPAATDQLAQLELLRTLQLDCDYPKQASEN